jgi:hypothetical protein
MRTPTLIGLFLLLSGSTALADGDGLTMHAVDQVVERYDREIQACNRGGSRHDTVVVMVELTVDEAGHVGSASSSSRTPIAACLEKVARKMVFPATGINARLALPFMLTPRR